MADTLSYKRFDVVEVREEDVVWGTKEGYPTFLKVKLTGVTVAEAQFLMDVEYDPDGALDIDTGKPQHKLHKRGWRVVENRITPPILAQLEAAWMVSGEYVIDNADGMLAWLEKKLDGSGKAAWR
jgi:hypothetical protein